MSTVISSAQLDAIRHIKNQAPEYRKRYVRFHPNDDIVESTARLLRVIRERIGPIEYRELDDGNWCIRTIPQHHQDVKLAALGSTFRLAAKRMMQIMRVM